MTTGNEKRGTTAKTEAKLESIVQLLISSDIIILFLNNVLPDGWETV